MTADAFAVLPEADRTAPDPLVAAALERFERDTRRDQLGCTRPEPGLCFPASGHVVVRDGWGEIIGRVPIHEIQTN